MSLSPVYMADPRFEIVSKYITADFPNACILYIDEVQNPALLTAFENKVVERDATEKTLFHGTKATSVNKIALCGFDPTKNRISAFGVGTYFATRASMSLQYTDVDRDGVSYVFVCRVLVGKTALGRSNAAIPEGIDNYVNSATTPTIYVSPYADGAYPQYLVAFHKSAQ